MHPLLREIESSYRRTDLPELRSGDSVRVHTLIKEGDKERVQVFEGVVIGQHRGGSRASFTVRKVSYGVGVERIFPLHTSRIEKIEVVSRGEVRRARLNYLRELRGQGRAHQGREEPAARDAGGSPTAAPAAADKSRPAAAPRPATEAVSVTAGRSNASARGRGDRAARRGSGRRAPGGGRAAHRRAQLARGPRAEIDIVADDAGTCVFVEVRSRTGDDRGHPLEAVTPQKQARVIRAARLYLDAETPAAKAYRFDVVAVTFWPDGRSPDVVHVADAFRGRRLASCALWRLAHVDAAGRPAA